MEKDRAQKRAESLEKTIQNHTLYLKKAVEEFQKKCLSIIPQKNIPLDRVIDIREGYKEIQNRFTEVKATQQLVKEKYRSFARKDPVREKELNELESQAETCYSKFEYTLILRERDIIERYSKEELRGVLIHLKEVDPSEMESILQRFMKSGRFSHLKCLLLRIQSQTDVGREVMDLISRNVQEMAEGDVVTLSI